MLSVGRLGKGIVLSALVVSLVILAGYAPGGSREVTIAILPCKDVVMTFKRFHPLADYLKQETGMDMKIVVPEDLATFEKDLRNGDIDFVFQDPYTYVRLSDLYNRNILLKGLTRDGGTLQSGVVIARKDSGISKVEDLRGKTVMFGPKLSATNWVLAKLLFEEKGIDIDKDLRAFSHGKCCEDIAFNVYLKTVDAGVVCDHFLEEHSEKQQELGIAAEEIIVIDRTKLIPTNVFSANRSLSEDFIMMIDQALLKLDKEKSADAKLLSSAELGGFETARDDDYDGIRMLIDKRNDG